MRCLLDAFIGRVIGAFSAPRVLGLCAVSWMPSSVASLAHFSAPRVLGLCALNKSFKRRPSNRGGNQNLSRPPELGNLGGIVVRERTFHRNFEVAFASAFSNVRNAPLENANLREINLSEANLSRANLSRADLSEANLSRANLSRADLSDANLSPASLSDANLSRANLSRAFLSRANLSDANLSRANLSDANLSRADLSRANLSRANLSRADLSGANLGGANLSGANFRNSEIDDKVQNLTPKQVKSACYWQKAKFDLDFEKELKKEPDQQVDCHKWQSPTN
ncbi:putative low-complexity protein (plasmid) [Allocoleopsis franciscana PCC 7113]|uniref:Putative low-complexity protein n=1 Tax=Allocoleopsis franciscana PCC 7113 TaxID=1173027 RepID=K9WR35_9CYAN|nr:pentapeptide repeat-containing protein [Allocoleopsis franciscana]AFZ22256.1 putative low-complexity protein [Allocoleopsis franciscana PCC 7113]